jgi:medium-chain acyl-[acyl-carrier-protein] hydrolase
MRLRQSRLIKNLEQIRSEKPVLFCFPFAGGGASAYSGWIKSLADEITVCPVQLPGREERITEKPYTDIEELLADLAEMIRPALKNKVVFWGHSMGAKIAFALEKRLETENLGADQLIVSGSRVPCIPEPHPIYHLPDAQFITELGRFEGTPKEILANEALFHFFLPMLRADFTMDETYYSEAAVVLNVPSPPWAVRKTGRRI